jgi:Ni,Fe-hydrogenase I cytochrome b subunit
MDDREFDLATFLSPVPRNPERVPDDGSAIWDAPTRWFHWINLVLVVLLVLSGFFFMYREAFQVTGREAKMALKIAHVWVGYAFAVVLAARFVWAFVGSPGSQWRAILPDRESLRSIGAELRGLRDRRLVRHLARSPLGRLSATLMFGLMLLLALTGLFRAGTDLYHLPLGPAVARYVAGPATDPSLVGWRNEEALADPQRMARLNQVKRVAGLPHGIGSWLFSALIVAHIAGVLLTEIRQRSGLISTMVSGYARDPHGPGPAPRDA